MVVDTFIFLKYMIPHQFFIKINCSHRSMSDKIIADFAVKINFIC